MDWPGSDSAGLGALGLLALTLLIGTNAGGSTNWIRIGPLSVQPSEFVKIAFIFVGTSTLDRLQTKKNIGEFLIFTGACIGLLALMPDFGMALILFATFLIIAFMRSGSVRTIALVLAGAVLAVLVVLTVKPYVLDRFMGWGHVWEHINDNLGYSQTRTLTYLASGGLFGRGVGNGWLKNVGAANTDLVFGVIAEEMGLILAVCCVIAILLLALFAVKEAATARSSFYVIAACSTAMIFVVQVMLNVFGSTDLLPLTGVTFPFVSCGGSSMISCWALLAYIKASDTRQNSALAVKLPKRVRRRRGEELPPEPPQESVPPADTADPIIPQDGPLYTDADDWQRYFKWEGDDE